MNRNISIRTGTSQVKLWESAKYQEKPFAFQQIVIKDGNLSVTKRKCYLYIKIKKLFKVKKQGFLKKNVSKQLRQGLAFLSTAVALARLETKDLKKNKCLSFRHISDPTNVDSQNYELTIKIFNSGIPEEWIIFLRDIKSVLVGQNITKSSQ
jgi:hypothetical protein